jgi:hypothetical protein
MTSQFSGNGRRLPYKTGSLDAKPIYRRSIAYYECLREKMHSNQKIEGEVSNTVKRKA